MVFVDFKKDEMDCSKDWAEIFLVFGRASKIHYNCPKNFGVQLKHDVIDSQYIFLKKYQ